MTDSDEKFWHKNFIDLNDKWNILKYQMMALHDHSKAKMDRMKLESFTGDFDEGFNEVKAECESYETVLEIMKNLRDEN